MSGAGPAGLLAARSILDHRPDAEVEIFEKRGMAGKRLRLSEVEWLWSPLLVRITRNFI